MAANPAADADLSGFSSQLLDQDEFVGEPLPSALDSLTSAAPEPLETTAADNLMIDAAAPVDDGTDKASALKPKRLASIICRRRKLRCDGGRPRCGTCARLGHACTYDESRRKSGPKRGYVKALEERLKQVETLLHTAERAPQSTQSAASGSPAAGSVPPPSSKHRDPELEAPWRPRPLTLDGFDFNASVPLASDADPPSATFGWDAGASAGSDGLDEPLPSPELVDQLHRIYFDKVHPSAPMIHRFRYLAALDLSPSQRPPVCLRYAMWALACSVSDRFSDLGNLFYERARRSLEADYIKGHGEHIMTIAHCQAHILLACYEMKMMYFPHAWINTGSAVRLCQMIGLHRLDGSGLDVKQCLPPPKDWTEREERRRTFWMAFCEDRYASIGTGWPMTADERDVMTALPASDDAFDMSRPEQTPTLAECSSAAGVAKLSQFGGVAFLACLFGRNLIHLHWPDDGGLDHDLNGPFWKRHRRMDAILVNTARNLPTALRLPDGGSGPLDPGVVFTNMSIHTSAICLHQAAIFKADKKKLGAAVSSESKVRCMAAANEITAIMRTASATSDLSAMHPFMSFCLYVAARVYAQYLKSRPDEVRTADSLRFLLSAMKALKQQNPLTESFLVQLDASSHGLASRVDSSEPSGGRDATSGVDDDPLSSDAAGAPGLAGSEATSSSHHLFGMGYGDESASASGTQGLGGSGAFGHGWPSSDQASMADMTPTPGPSMMHQRRVSSAVRPSSGLGDGSREEAPTTDQSPQLGFVGAGMGVAGTDAGGDVLVGEPTALNGGMAPNGWPDTGDMSTRMPPLGGLAEGVPPLGEGVLRALMTMGPMDAMDLSAWEPEETDASMKG